MTTAVVDEEIETDLLYEGGDYKPWWSGCNSIYGPGAPVDHLIEKALEDGKIKIHHNYKFKIKVKLIDEEA